MKWYWFIELLKTCAFNKKITVFSSIFLGTKINRLQYLFEQKHWVVSFDSSSISQGNRRSFFLKAIERHHSIIAYLSITVQLVDMWKNALTSLILPIQFLIKGILLESDKRSIDTGRTVSGVLPTSIISIMAFCFLTKKF